MAFFQILEAASLMKIQGKFKEPFFKTSVRTMEYQMLTFLFKTNNFNSNIRESKLFPTARGTEVC